MSEETTGTPTPVAALNPVEHRQAIQTVLDQIRPALQNDGGDCELVDVSEDGKTVFLRLQGACAHCPSSIYTLKYGIESVLRELVPGVETVEAV
jgi:Fe-S cluster biogenesis protein NfuA